jgi:hypothetical protein
MNDEPAVLSRDLEILVQMSLELSQYLRSDSVRWTMARGDMPPLTLGGCLMRRHRLNLLAHKLDYSLQRKLDFAGGRIRNLLDDNVVRFETRSAQEFHARMSEWMGHLRGWATLGRVSAEQYASKADGRLVLWALVEALRQPPFELDPAFESQLEQVDNHLRGCWQSSDFVLPPVWRPVYPLITHWWLHGRPAYREGRSYPILALDTPVSAQPN